MLRYSNSQALKERFPSSAAPCRRVRWEHELHAQSPEEVYLLPPPPLASAIPPTQPTDCPWIAHRSPTGSRESPSEPPWRRLGCLRRLWFALLGVLGDSRSLQMPFKRVLDWKLAGNALSKCSARALRGPCTLLKPSKSTVLSSDFMVFAFREGNAYSIALRRRFASTRRLGRAPVDALRPSWAIFGASWGALGLFFGCFGLPNSPQKSQSLPKSLKIR